MPNTTRLTRLLAIAIAGSLFPACAPKDDDVPFREPVHVVSKDGKVDSPLYVVFGSVKIPGKKGGEAVNVRSYALPKVNPLTGEEFSPEQTPPMLPGPTFVFKPGELLRLRFQNYLNRSANPRLNADQNNPQETGPAAADDTDEHVSHEISIPNDSDVTNLHVHGLHVDPKQDDVTLLILPEDNDPSSLTPELQQFVPTINRWWTRNYQYKIPLDHLPGTYWYHAHKHGSTSTQVENGMAGTLLMLPREGQSDLVDGLWSPDPAKTHDRVMMMQGIANYGVRQNRSRGQPRKPNVTSPVTTINGQHESTLQLPVGQIERWRFVVAGANHVASSYLWVGKITPVLSAETQAALAGITATTKAGSVTVPPATFPCSALPGNVKLVAADAITLWQPRDVTPGSPGMGSAGNRITMLVQASADAAQGGPYRIYQNYPFVKEDVIAAYPALFGEGVRAPDVQARLTALQSVVSFEDAATSQPVPNNFATDPYALGTNYQGMKIWWTGVDAEGNSLPLDPKLKPVATPADLPVAPLLRGTADGKGVKIDESFATQTFGDGEGRWQPMPDAGGGQPVTQAILVNLDISGTATGPTTWPENLDTIASSLSPAGTGSSLDRVDPHTRQLVPGIPSYVAPITDADIAGAQVAVFDRGQFTFNYVDSASRTQLDFRQFWINGRQFSVNDWIGNPIAERLMNEPLDNVEPSLGEYSPNAAASTWTHQRSAPKGNEIVITNPGYNLKIKSYGTIGKGEAFNYDYDSAPPPLSYDDVTGLETSHTPVSTTAEEWLLVNNSDLFHPFHIHISPFFVTEVGQLNYDTDEKKWSLKKITLADKGNADVPFSWVVGNWWDVITMPPHGYIRFRTWINVPSQLPVDNSDPESDLYVHDNANVYGSWVLHCHILRHEDRGMMSMVNTEPKGVDLTGDDWFQDDGATFSIEDNHGGLLIQQETDTPYGGRWNRGIGNPLYSQPWLGSTSPGTSTLSMCVVNGAAGDTADPNPFAAAILLSDGHIWARGAAPPAIDFATTAINLTGDWSDNYGNVAHIEQAATATNGPDKGVAQLTFTPKSPVWWVAGGGEWSPPSAPPAGVYAGTQRLFSVSAPGRKEGIKFQNQKLTFCVSGDGNMLVFGNGITWMRQR